MVQPWMLVLLHPRHLVDKRLLLMLLLRLKIADGCLLGWLLTPGLLLLLLRRRRGWLLLLRLLPAVAVSISRVAIACSWGMGSWCCLILMSRGGA